MMRKLADVLQHCSPGKTLYAERDKSGKFEEMQTYKRTHRSDSSV